MKTLFELPEKIVLKRTCKDCRYSIRETRLNYMNKPDYQFLCTKKQILDSTPHWNIDVLTWLIKINHYDQACKKYKPEKTEIM